MYGNKQNKPYNLPSIRFEMKITHFLFVSGICHVSLFAGCIHFETVSYQFLDLHLFIEFFFILKELFIKRSKSKLGI